MYLCMYLRQTSMTIIALNIIQESAQYLAEALY